MNIELSLFPFNVDIISYILGKININELKYIRLINHFYCILVDQYLLNSINLKRRIQFTKQDLDNLPIVIFYQFMKKHKKTSNLLFFAIKNNYFTLVKYLYTKGYTPSIESIDNAALKGHLNILKFFYEKEKLIPHYKVIHDVVSKEYYDIINWLEQFNIIPNQTTANILASKGKLNILILLEKKDILPSEQGVNKAIQNNHFEIVKWLYERKIYCTQFNNENLAKHGNLEMISWLWNRNYKFTYNDVCNSIRYGHLHVLKFIHKKDICYKEEILNSFPEDEEDRDDEDNENIEWIQQHEGKILCLPVDLNHVCNAIYNNENNSENNKLAESKHLKILNWFEKHLNIIPTSFGRENTIIPESFEVIKWLSRRNILPNNQILNICATKNYLHIIKFFVEECKTIPYLDIISRSIYAGHNDITDYILNSHYQGYIMSQNLDFISELINKFHNIKEVDKYQDFETSKEDNFQINSRDNILEEISSNEILHNLMLSKNLSIKSYEEELRKIWYAQYLPPENVIAFVYSFTKIDTIEWMFKWNIPVTHLTFNSAIKRELIDCMNFLYENDIRPMINVELITYIISCNKLNSLKWLINKKLINSEILKNILTQRTFTNIVNIAAKGGYLDMLKYIHLTFSQFQLKTLPDSIGFFEACSNRKVKVIKWLIINIFQLIDEYKKTIRDLLNEIESYKKRTKDLSSVIEQYQNNNKDKDLSSMFKQYKLRHSDILFSIEKYKLQDKVDVIPVTHYIFSIFPNQSSINIMAKYNMLNYIKKLTSVMFIKEQKFNILPNREAANYAAQRNKFKTLKYLEKNNILPTVDGLNYAATYGHFRILKYFANESIIQKNYIKKYIISDIKQEKDDEEGRGTEEKRDVQIITRDINFEPILPNSDGANEVCRQCKSIDILNWFINKNIFPTSVGANNALLRNDLQIIKILWNLNIRPTREGFDLTMDVCGKSESIIWIQEQNVQLL